MSFTSAICVDWISTLPHFPLELLLTTSEAEKHPLLAAFDNDVCPQGWGDADGGASPDDASSVGIGWITLHMAKRCNKVMCAIPGDDLDEEENSSIWFVLPPNTEWGKMRLTVSVQYERGGSKYIYVPRSISLLVCSVCLGWAVRPTMMSREYLCWQKSRFAVAARLGSSWTALSSTRPDAMLETCALGCDVIGKKKPDSAFYYREMTADVLECSRALVNVFLVFFECSFKWCSAIVEFKSKFTASDCCGGKCHKASICTLKMSV